tara:strand:+ start:10345 stop:11460 length:1116 start_codon:yes stop_codon:yes gene_type:complete
MVIGGVITMLALMSVVGLVTENIWGRLAGALVIGIAVPAIVADRALPEDAAEARGTVTDVFAMMWMGFAVLFAVVGISFTDGMLRNESGRLVADGWTKSGELAAWIAGPAPKNDQINSEVALTQPVMPLDAGIAEEVAEVEAVASSDAGVEEVPVTAKTTREKMPPSDLFKKWAPSVVTIQTGKGMLGAGSGTGFIVDSKGIMVTNHHVIDGADRVSVKLMDGKWADEVELLVQDKKLDIAILRIKSKSKLQAVTFGDSEKVTVGERAISIGNPLGLEHTLADGLVSARRLKDGRKMIQMSTPVSPGNSGGPLFNAYGEVIGVTSESMSSRGYGENLGMAVAIDHVKPMLKKKYKEPKRIGGGSPEGGGTW